MVSISTHLSRLIGVPLVCCCAIAGCRGCGSVPPAAFALGPPSAAGSAPVSRRLLARAEVPSLPGWETRIYLIEYASGASAPRHIHPEVGIGYVLSGRFESAFEGESPSVVEEGQSFVDKANVEHRL